MCHPKDVHFWKNIIHNLKNEGHEVKIVAWDKDVTLYLLDTYGFDYEIIGRSYKSLLGKTYDMFRSDIRVFNIAKKFKPDVFIHGDPYLAHISKVLRKKHIEYCDTEHAKLVQLTTFPFTDIICTPSCFMKKIDSSKHIMFNGYSELAYLHPNYFKPDPILLDNLGLSKNEKFIIIRFVAWEASHDIKQHGFTDKEKFIKMLENYGRVFISSEKRLNNKFEKYKINVPPEHIHDLLYYATMYIGEGATMASESAILGTPALYINTLRLGYTNEEEEKYGLLYNFSNPQSGQIDAMSKAIELLENKNLKKEWKIKRQKMLNEKIDVTKFMTELILNINKKNSIKL